MVQPMAGVMHRMLSWARRHANTALVVGMLVQCGVLAGWLGYREWVVRGGGTLIRLQVEPLEPYGVVQGQRIRFVPTVFQHSFESTGLLQPGQWVVVQPIDAGAQQWGLRVTPQPGRPYLWVQIKTANQGHYFVTPPFQSIRVSAADAKAVARRFDDTIKGNTPDKVSMSVAVRQSGSTWVVAGIWVSGRFYRRY